MFLGRVMSWRTIGRSSGQKINVEAASKRNVCNIVHIKHTFVQLEKMHSPSRPHVQTLTCYVLRRPLSLAGGSVKRVYTLTQVLSMQHNAEREEISEAPLSVPPVCCTLSANRKPQTETEFALSLEYILPNNHLM